MSKIIESPNGTTLKVTSGSSEQTVGQGNYDANTNITGVRHHLNGIRESATSRNLEISGNSQEVMNGRGITCCYSIKMVGTPELFSGEVQRKLDKALAKLTSIMLQPGDDRHQAVALPVPFPSAASVVSKMTSAAQTTTQLELPTVNGVADLPLALEAIETWASKISVADAAEKTTQAGLLEAKRQANQIEITARQKLKEFGENFQANPLSSLFSSPASQDTNKKHNISTNDVKEAYLEQVDVINSAQSNLC